MTASPNQPTSATKWHVYRYPQKPGTRIVLGSILAEPDDIKSSLNKESGIKPFPKDKTQDDSQVVRQAIQSELSSTHGGHLKTILPIPATDAGSAEAVVEALDIHAESIVLDTAKRYVEEALSTAPGVADCWQKAGLRKELYMIVGVATCKRLSAGGASGPGQTDTSAGSESGGRDECAFAYRLRKLRLSGGQDEPREAPVFDGFENQDQDVNSLAVLDGLAMQIAF